MPWYNDGPFGDFSEPGEPPEEEVPWEDRDLPKEKPKPAPDNGEGKMMWDEKTHRWKPWLGNTSQPYGAQPPEDWPKNYRTQPEQGQKKKTPTRSDYPYNGATPPQQTVPHAAPHSTSSALTILIVLLCVACIGAILCYALLNSVH